MQKLSISQKVIKRWTRSFFFGISSIFYIISDLFKLKIFLPKNWKAPVLSQTVKITFFNWKSEIELL